MQKLIEEITPFYRPEAIREFQRAKEKVQVIEKKKALKIQLNHLRLILCSTERIPESS